MGKKLFECAGVANGFMKSHFVSFIINEGRHCLVGICLGMTRPIDAAETGYIPTGAQFNPHIAETAAYH